MTKTVLITGTSSGIGYAAVEHFSKNEWNVAATMRKPDSEAGQALSKLPNVEVIALDVTSRESIKAAIESTIAKFGCIDAVINNAGYGLCGPMEFGTDEQIQRQYATNVYGPVYVMQAVLPLMRERKSGVIVNVTSVGGLLSLPLCSLYHGTKYALEGITESAAMEVRPFGVKLRLVEPGGVRTDFSGRSMALTTSETDRSYDVMLQNAVEGFAANTAAGSDPPQIAEVLYEAVTDEGDRIRYLAGEDAKAMIAARKEVSDEEHAKNLSARFKMMESV